MNKEDLARLKHLAGILTEEKLSESLLGFRIPTVKDDKFESSSDFDTAYGAILDMTEQTVDILKSKAMNQWMSATAKNFDFDINEYKDILNSLVETDKKLKDLYKKLIEITEK